MHKTCNILIMITLLLGGKCVVAGHGHANGKLLPAPVTDRDYYDQGATDPGKVELGRKLFFDKILSGNLNTSCATCHHVLTDTGDGLSLPVGEGGRGLGVTRDTGTGVDTIHERVPRNAPPVFNLGAREFSRMFHDGRVEAAPSWPSGFLSPAGKVLPEGLDNALAVQAMFPVTSGTEMAGQAGENPQADAAAAGNLPLVWDIIATRLQHVDEYAALFASVYGIDRDQISYVHAANAIAAFEASAWRFDDSPFDRYLRGDATAMSAAAIRGMQLFYGRAGCADCHSGPFLTDQDFHAIAMPQIGPGKGDNLEIDGFVYTDGRDDFGRERVTGDAADRFRFRTPTLRNVALTAPYGHSGAYSTLEAAVRHHLDPIGSLYRYDISQARLPAHPDLDVIDDAVMSDPTRVAAIAAASELPPVNLNRKQVVDLLEFLHALTDPNAIDLRDDIPAVVPSGLPLAE